ncbi:BTAD domain-containing putative transcriptional regulator [Demequina salsinemoris]|uniref:BTAD domain-containing putative transcriptional regulator n=1 Tax=Demequina salsinemoris TaxID=577470 RepID=UPI00078455F5|nr:BTAD domain-containing putative transcriptional regulator [Demequina salsinemoris]
MLTIHMLGRPRLERDGEALAGPRGAKCWALLARVLRSEAPVSRERLVEELFADADDPYGALRWSLAELRRRLGLKEALSGNPVSADLGPDVSIDVLDQLVGTPPSIVLGNGRFLEGIEPRASATFEMWLTLERRRVDADVLAALRRQVLNALSRGEPERAAGIAQTMIARDPLDEGSHVLFVKALAASGARDAAVEHARETEEMVLRETGEPLGPALRDAARRAPPTLNPSVSSRATCETLREAGRAALSAGAVDAGVECMRGAIAAAESIGDAGLLATCLHDLGTAFVHNVCGYDDEGMVLLETAVSRATEAGLPSVGARALAELGYVDLLFGRSYCAEQRLATARVAAGEDREVLAAVASFEGTHLHDLGRLEESLARFEESIAHARASGDVRREIWALGMGARTVYSLGDHAGAESWARTAIEMCDADRWTSYRPWPESWVDLARLAQGADPIAVRDSAEATYAMATQLRDACWEGLAAEVLAMTYAATGDVDDALRWLRVGKVACRRDTDAYAWVATEIAVTTAELLLAHGRREEAGAAAREAAAEAAAFHMDRLLERAEAVAVATSGSVASDGVATSEGVAARA